MSLLDKFKELYYPEDAELSVRKAEEGVGHMFQFDDEILPPEVYKLHKEIHLTQLALTKWEGLCKLGRVNYGYGRQEYPPTKLEVWGTRLIEIEAGAGVSTTLDQMRISAETCTLCEYTESIASLSENCKGCPIYELTGTDCSAEYERFKGGKPKFMIDLLVDVLDRLKASLEDAERRFIM